MNSDVLCVHFDASARIASGHVKNCLALAQAWQRRGVRGFITRDPVMMEGKATGGRDDQPIRLGYTYPLIEMPAQLQPDFVRLSFTPVIFPEAERCFGECIMPPMFPAMRNHDVVRVRSALIAALGVYSLS